MQMATPDPQTAQHPLEAELHDLLANDPEMWRFLQQGSLDGVWYWNLEEPQHEWMSPEFWQVLGIDPATKRHDPAEWQDIIFEEDLALAIENFHHHCENPDHPYDQVVRYRHADGSTVWARCRGIAIRDETGRAVRMLGAHNDLTAVKRAEEKALRDARRLKVANDELQSFAYGVSHDLKSPSRTALQLVQEGIFCNPDALSEEQMTLFEGACSTLMRMQDLIEDLLDYGRLVEDGMAWHMVDLDDVVRVVLEDLRAEIEQAEAVVHVAPLGRIEGHPSQMRMLIQNLLANAIKFHRTGVRPKVMIRTREMPDGGVILSVEDNGCGISNDKVDRIFDVFTRLHRQDEVPGSGVGLAMCKRIAANHNGVISVTSEPGRGSVFEVRLNGVGDEHDDKP